MSPASRGHAGSVLPVEPSVLEQIVLGRHGNPHGVLGAHVHDGAVTVRSFRPLAESVVVVSVVVFAFCWSVTLKA